MFGYRYEMIQKEKSLWSVAAGPGFYYYRVPLRPQAKGDGSQIAKQKNQVGAVIY